MFEFRPYKRLGRIDTNAVAAKNGNIKELRLLYGNNKVYMVFRFVDTGFWAILGYDRELNFFVAYIQVPEDMPDAVCESLDVHGGVTFIGHVLKGLTSGPADVRYAGFDYGHHGDIAPGNIIDGESHFINLTPVQEVIDELVKVNKEVASLAPREARMNKLIPDAYASPAVCVGWTVETVEGMETGSEEILLGFTNGLALKLCHDQDCCESVQVLDVVGDPKDLIGTPLLKIEWATSNSCPTDIVTEGEYHSYEIEKEGKTHWFGGDSNTWTFIKLATIKGSVDIRWWGSSNGYYGENVNAKILIPSGKTVELDPDKLVPDESETPQIEGPKE